MFKFIKVLRSSKEFQSPAYKIDFTQAMVKYPFIGELPNFLSMYPVSKKEIPSY